LADEKTSKVNWVGLLQSYYILTPLFLATELIWGAKIRIPFILTDAALRYSYYGVCFGCGALCFFRQKWTPVVAFVESTVNVVLLFVGLCLTIANYYLEAIEGNFENISGVLTHNEISGFVLVAAVWSIAFNQSVWNLSRREKTT